MKRLAIIALSLATALTSVPPAMAFPTIAAPAMPKVEVPEAQPVQYRRYRGGYNRGWGGYHGGHRHHHHNDNDDWGWALGGLAAGALIGGLLAQPRYYGPTYYDEGYYAPAYRPRYYAPRYYRQSYYGGNAHTNWCYARYRSYRAYDNTFQPYYGPRQVCVSPYY
ncbi:MULTISPECIES: BA14K family protein [unclassified Sinorhizobium]|uniref:BA14K family protein n=1 Tax=unclassified Sinorhizobium TaxID=2613772 RepID=UPI0024C36570|nr:MULTISPECIES: BA14K family protein [unclassified Sinorhizobium]MDK1373432.1 BA14K family protein [Sinorhizobium sp. 6-70]MDK1481267.1 BA14K family protein [Sinorhizobium sp. 6-117]